MGFLTGCKTNRLSYWMGRVRFMEKRMKVFAFGITVLFLFVLLSGCDAKPGMTAATFTPAPVPTQTGDFEDLLDQAAGQVPFTLLVPDESKLPFEIEPTGVEIVPGLKTQPFVVSQSYRAQGNVIRITQTSQIGQMPAKAIRETPVRGVVGYWVILSAGDRLLYLEENNSSLTIGGNLTDEDILILADVLVPREAGTK